VPRIKRGNGKVAEAAIMRWAPIARGEPPMGYEEIGKRLGIARRTVIRWTRLPEWLEAVASLDSPEFHRELAAQALARLGTLLPHKDPKVVLAAGRSILEFTIGRRLEVDSRAEVVNVSHFDFAGMTAEQVRVAVGAVAEARGIRAGRPMAALVGRDDVIDAEVRACG